MLPHSEPLWYKQRRRLCREQLTLSSAILLPEHRQFWQATCASLDCDHTSPTEDKQLRTETWSVNQELQWYYLQEKKSLKGKTGANAITKRQTDRMAITLVYPLYIHHCVVWVNHKTWQVQTVINNKIYCLLQRIIWILSGWTNLPSIQDLYDSWIKKKKRR